MLRIFWGMIIGSMITMMLLGGASAADQVFAKVGGLDLDQINRPNASTTLLLLVVLSIFLGALALWPAKPLMNKKTMIKRLHRYCS